MLHRSLREMLLNWWLDNIKGYGDFYHGTLFIFHFFENTIGVDLFSVAHSKYSLLNYVYTYEFIAIFLERV
jgi:hypothetical protein